MRPGTLLALTFLAGCGREPAPSTRAPSPEPGRTPVPAGPAAQAVAPLALLLDETGTHLSGDSTVLVPLADDPSRGADAAYKRSGPNALYLVPLAQALESGKSAGRIRVPLRVVVSRNTRYRVLIEALYTAGQTEIGEFELCEGGCDTRTFSFAPPRLPEAGSMPPERPTLDLAALIVQAGIRIKGSGGNIAPGCEDVGGGIAVPRRGDSLDLAAFQACIAKVRASSPDFANEDTATITANPGTPFHEVMDVALALRALRFPKLRLGVPN